ncbi:phage tail protein [Nocardia sp. CA-119907]|uniref:phage tail protein n=1 Tax=Nocardia sp. CA-119907 TaxID=3239973 RepID=UPI003D985587
MPEPARKPKPPRPPHNPATPVRTVGTANAMQRLQATAGNGAVAALFAQRLSAGEGASAYLPPTVAPTPTTPRQDPKFAAATDHIAAESAAAKAHPAPAKEVKAAQDAATAPADDKEAQAQAAHTATMAAAKPAGFDKAGFIAAVKAAIAAKAPKNLDEADKFATSGKADQVKNEVLGKVGAGKEASAKNVADTTKATPDTSVAKDKPVTPMPAAPPARQPVAPDPAAAAPKPAPAEQVRLGAGSCETDAKMAEAGVTDEQLAKSNEPEFTGALAAKQELRAHDATAPAQFRQQEAATLAAAKDQAGASAKSGLAAMGSAKAATLHAAGAGKDATKANDEAERARITGEIKKIFAATKTEVEKILADLDGLVAKKFEDGERQAKEAFTADHKERMWQYKLRRYAGPLGPTLWVKDLLLDMPAEANNLFLESKKLYETRMSAVIADIADTVGTELGRAKDRIAQGRTQVQKFVAEQPTNLQKLAGRAVGEIGSQFDELEKSVDEKQQSLVDDLATRYAEARDGIDEEIKKLQDENKGLVGKTIDAVGGAIETIKKLKDMLLGVLARAAGAVEKIIKDPIVFLGNFVNAVKAGITNFMSNIGTHLKKGLQGWLFGALAEAGIEIPAKFDLKGIITLLLSLLGLTWNSIRARIVKVVGEPAMQKIEGAVDFVKAIVTEGIPGLWKWIAQKITDLKEQVMGQIREFVITKVITAGITWLISLLNPAAAFIKACKMIYDAVMWFVDNAERLKEFVDSVLDSVESIASGGVGKVAALIEGTLSKTVPMLISGLASLLGLGGIADKIKKILETVQKPVGRVVDKLIGVAVKYGKKFLTKLKNSKAGKFATGLKEKGKAAYAKGKAAITRVFKGSFSVDGTAHTVKAESPTPGAKFTLTIASKKDYVAPHQHNAAKEARKKGKRDVAQEALDIIGKAAKVEALVNSKDIDEARKRDAIAEFALIVQQVWARIGYQGEPPTEGYADDGTKGVVGEVGRHRDQGTRGYRGADTRAKEDRLMSEHVIPRGWLMVFLDNFHGVVKRKSRDDKQLYGRMTTIMLYKGASDYKTAERKTADNTVLNKLKQLADGHPRVKNPQAVAAAIRQSFDGPLANRVKFTKEARDYDHQANQRKGTPQPSDSTIEGAALRQLLDVIEFLAKSVDDSDSAADSSGKTESRDR